MMTKIALGTVQFGFDYGLANVVGQVKRAEVEQILSQAKENEIDVLDTAVAYGISEDVLGSIGVDQFRVVTKLPPVPEDLSDIQCWVRRQVAASLKRLRQEKLYGLLLHQPQDLLGLQGAHLIHALADLKAANLVQKVGVSIYSPFELDEIFKKIKIDLVQAPLNVIDRRMETSGWLDRLKDGGIEIHVRSVFLQGLLLMDSTKRPAKFGRWANLWDSWDRILRDAETSRLDACLAYPLALEQLDRVIVGVDSVAQLSEILGAAEFVRDVPDTSGLASTDVRLIDPSNWDYL